jgi:hypothetical protein
MRKLLVITIDTEVDKSSDWKVSKEESYRSVLEGIPDRLEPLFMSHGAKATYLLSGEVMERDDCRDLLRSLKNAELGTHLHGQLVKPLRFEGPLAGRNFDAMQCAYDEKTERMKMITLTDMFKERFGHAPVSFRAGRFGAGKNTAKILSDLGYKVDSSVSPGMDWDFVDGRVDFMNAPTQPYHADLDDIRRPGTSTLLEVPVTIRASWFRKKFHSTSNTAGGRAWNRVANKAMRSTWFRPSHHSLRQMIKAGYHEVHINRDQDVVVLNMMFHSMEAVAGASPYAKDEDEAHELLSRVDGALHWARDNDFKFVTLSELPWYYRDYEKNF